MADLQPHVPQAIEDRLGDRLAPGGLLVGQQEEEIDVGAGRHQAAAVAAGGDDRHALGFRRILRGIEVLADELVEDADDLVLQAAQPLGAVPAVAVLEQQLLGDDARVGERRLQALRHRDAQLALASVKVPRQRLERGLHRGRVDQVAGVSRMFDDGHRIVG